MKLHGSVNRGGIIVKTCTKSTCSHILLQCSQILLQDQVLSVLKCTDESSLVAFGKSLFVLVYSANAWKNDSKVVRTIVVRFMCPKMRWLNWLCIPHLGLSIRSVWQLLKMTAWSLFMLVSRRLCYVSGYNWVCNLFMPPHRPHYDEQTTSRRNRETACTLGPLLWIGPKAVGRPKCQGY